MLMFPDLEALYLVRRIRQLALATQSIEPLENKGPIFEELKALTLILEKNARSLTWFRDHFPELQFVDTDTESLPVDVRMSSRTHRAEAIDMRNRLVYEGLTHFRLTFGPYGDFVEPMVESPEAGALDRMRLAYERTWTIYRNPDNGVYKFTSREAFEETRAQSMADSMADEVKRRWPWGWFAVFVPVAVAEGEPPVEPKKATRQ